MRVRTLLTFCLVVLACAVGVGLALRGDPSPPTPDLHPALAHRDSTLQQVAPAVAVVDSVDTLARKAHAKARRAHLHAQVVDSTHVGLVLAQTDSGPVDSLVTVHPYIGARLLADSAQHLTDSMQVAARDTVIRRQSDVISADSTVIATQDTVNTLQGQALVATRRRGQLYLAAAVLVTVLALLRH